MRKYLSIVLSLILLLTGCGKSQIGPTWQEQYDLGVRYLSEGNYEEAIIAFTAAIEIDPKQEDAYIGLAEVYAAQGDTGKATEILDKGIAEIGETESLANAKAQYVSEPTLEPMPEPTLKPTSGPTSESTPTPEATPEPTPEVTPDVTPGPTLDPTTEPTPEPTPETTPEPTPETESEPTTPAETVAVTDDPLTVTLAAGKNYKLTNSDATNNYVVSNNNAGSGRYDEARYKSDGSAICVQDNFGSFWVGANGTTIITVKDSPITVTFTEVQSTVLSIEETDEPALLYYALSAGRNYELSNSDVSNNYIVTNNAPGAGSYDEARYKNNGTVIHVQDNFGTFWVGAGGTTVITVKGNSFTAYMPYRWKTVLTLAETDRTANE